MIFFISQGGLEEKTCYPSLQEGMTNSLWVSIKIFHDSGAFCYSSDLFNGMKYVSGGIPLDRHYC